MSESQADEERCGPSRPQDRTRIGLGSVSDRTRIGLGRTSGCVYVAAAVMTRAGQGARNPRGLRHPAPGHDDSDGLQHPRISMGPGWARTCGGYLMWAGQDTGERERCRGGGQEEEEAGEKRRRGRRGRVSGGEEVEMTSEWS